MPERKEYWIMLLLLSRATRCNRAGAGDFQQQALFIQHSLEMPYSLTILFMESYNKALQMQNNLPLVSVALKRGVAGGSCPAIVNNLVTTGALIHLFLQSKTRVADPRQRVKYEKLKKQLIN